MKYLIIYPDCNGELEKDGVQIHDFPNKKELDEFLNIESVHPGMICCFPLIWLKDKLADEL